MTTPDATVRFPALGSTAVLAVVDRSRLGPARAAVAEVIDAFDRACSRFRADSELSAVNRGAGGTVAVGPLLLEAVQAALRAAWLTDGDVDPTVGQALIALGYDRDFAQLDPAVTVKLASVPGWRAVKLDAAARTVRVPRGVTLDLGATVKALAADRASEAALAAAGCGVLVSLGGDLAIAGEAPEDGWRVRVTDDHAAGVDAPGQWITLRSGGLATSSTAVRRWTGLSAAGEPRLVHHRLDPTPGAPVGGPCRTVSVAAATCLDANIASTAAIVRGDRAAAWLEELGLPSRLVDLGGVARHIAGWPEEGDDLASATVAISAGLPA